MNIDLKNNKKQKYIFNATCLILTFVLLTSSLGDIWGDTSPLERDSANNTDVSATKVIQHQEKTHTEQKSQGTANSLLIDASANILFGDDSSNPFVEIGDLIVDVKNPEQPVMTARTQAVSANLPAIPRPNIPVIPTPNPSGFSIPSKASAKPTPPPGVQGILTSDDGSSMAIMSDGSIVSEGDVYHDGRIAWIGGEGIHFDNGTSILYK